MYLDTVYYGVAITHLGNNHIEYSAFHWSSVFFCVSVCVFVLITWLPVLSESRFLPSQLKEMPVRRTEASSIDHTVNTQRGLHLPHRQSRCHARCTRGPRGTCHRPRQGTRSRGSPSQTNCRSLEHGQNNMTYVKKTNTFWASWDITHQPCQHDDRVHHHSPRSQYGSPSSRWKVLFLIGCWQEAQRKQ